MKIVHASLKSPVPSAGAINPLYRLPLSGETVSLDIAHTIGRSEPAFPYSHDDLKLKDFGHGTEFAFQTLRAIWESEIDCFLNPGYCSRSSDLEVAQSGRGDRPRNMSATKMTTAVCNIQSFH